MVVSFPIEVSIGLKSYGEVWEARRLVITESDIQCLNGLRRGPRRLSMVHTAVTTRRSESKSTWTWARALPRTSPVGISSRTTTKVHASYCVR